MGGFPPRLHRPNPVVRRGHHVLSLLKIDPCVFFFLPLHAGNHKNGWRTEVGGFFSHYSLGSKLIYLAYKAPFFSFFFPKRSGARSPQSLSSPRRDVERSLRALPLGIYALGPVGARVRAFPSFPDPDAERGLAPEGGEEVDALTCQGVRAGEGVG